jgi:two-component system, NarL family, nitrate/nitrite response regulator NarL
MSLEQKIRVLVADDHPIYRDGVRNLLHSERGFNVIGEAATGQDVLHLVNDLNPDVLLLDIRMPELTGLEVLKQLSKRPTSSLNTIVVTASIENTEIIEALLLGARGIVPKHASASLLLKSIRAVMAGEVWASRTITAGLIERLRGPNLSPTHSKILGLTRRELDIAVAVAEGQVNKDIAAKFHISEYTVKHHLTRIFEKLELSNRVELAMFAVNHHLEEHAEEVRTKESSSRATWPNLVRPA